MWYWIIMVLLILGSVALLSSTFISVKKNKKQDAERRKQSKGTKRRKADPEDDVEAEEEQPRKQRKRRQTAQDGTSNSGKKVPRKKRQWKIILEDLDTWQKYTFIFYDNVGIGRSRSDAGYERYLSLPEDGRVSKHHCVIVHRGNSLYLMDDGSRNGTYLNGILLERPAEIQREDVIGVGETRLEILRILRESE